MICVPFRFSFITAHYTAWKRAGVLHCDISIGNIMIHPVTRQGFLIDWELSRLSIELGEGPVEPDYSVSTLNVELRILVC